MFRAAGHEQVDRCLGGSLIALVHTSTVWTTNRDDRDWDQSATTKVVLATLESNVLVRARTVTSQEPEKGMSVMAW